MTNNNSVIVQIVDLVDHYYEKFSNELPVSLFGGRAGLSIFYYYIGEYLGKTKYLDKSRLLLESIGEELDSGIRISANALHTYASGLAGVGCSFSHMYRRNSLPFDYREAFSELGPFLIEASDRNYQAQCSDFLHGPMGVLLYLLREPNTEQNIVLAEKLYDMFMEIAIVDSKGLRIRNAVIEQEYDEFDLCMAHGLSGYLIIFGLLAEVSQRKSEIHQTMKLMIDYLTSCEQRDVSIHGGSGFFPTSINENFSLNNEINRKKYESRLAWCYGDLGISYSLVICGDTLRDHQLTDKGLETALFSTKRKKASDAGIGDIFFCHGSSGVSYMYKKLYCRTNETDFQFASNHWRDYTHKYFNQLNCETLGKNFSLNVLDGLPTVALSLMDSENDALFGWDEFFLLQ